MDHALSQLERGARRLPDRRGAPQRPDHAPGPREAIVCAGVNRCSGRHPVRAAAQNAATPARDCKGRWRLMLNPRRGLRLGLHPVAAQPLGHQERQSPAPARRSAADRRRCGSGSTGPCPRSPARRRCIRSRSCPSSRHARRRHRCPRRHDVEEVPTSRRMASNWRVLYRSPALIVLPCIGSHDQTTLALALAPRGAAAAASLRPCPRPCGTISVIRPGSFAGLRMSSSAAGRRDRGSGPNFMPIGFLMPRMNSTCAPSSWRVRSPIHRKCAGGRVPIAGGRIDAGQRLLVGQQQRLVAGVEIGLAECSRVVGGDAAGRHEGQRLVDAVARSS